MNIKFDTASTIPYLLTENPLIKEKGNEVKKKFELPLESYPDYKDDVELDATDDTRYYAPSPLPQSGKFTYDDVWKIAEKLKLLTDTSDTDVSDTENSNGLESTQKFGDYNNFSVNVMVMIMLYLIQNILPKEIEATNKMQENVLKFLENFNKANQALAVMSSQQAQQELEKAYQSASKLSMGAVFDMSMALGGAISELQGHLGSNAKSQTMMEEFNTKWSAAKDKIEQADNLLKGFSSDAALDQKIGSITQNTTEINKLKTEVNEKARDELNRKKTELGTEEIRPKRIGGLLVKDESSEITVVALEKIKDGQNKVIEKVTGGKSSTPLSNIQKLIDAEKKTNVAKNEVGWSDMDFSTTAGVTSGSDADKALNLLKQNQSLYNVTKDPATGEITEVAFISNFKSVNNNPDGYVLINVKYDNNGNPPKITEFNVYELDINKGGNSQNSTNFKNFYDLVVTNDGDAKNLYSYRNSEAIEKIEALYQLKKEDFEKKDSNGGVTSIAKFYGQTGAGAILDYGKFNIHKSKQKNYKAQWEGYTYTDQSNTPVTVAAGDNFSTPSTSVFGNARSEKGYELMRLAQQDSEYAKEYDELLFGSKFGKEGALQPFITRIESNKQRYDSDIKFRQAVNNALIAGGRSLEGVYNSLSQQDGADAKFEGEMLNLLQTLSNSNLQQMQQLINDLSSKTSQIVSDVMQTLLQAYQTMVQAANLRNGG